MRSGGEICCHFGDHRLKALVEHFLQILILPPGLGHMMIGENLCVGGGEEPCAKSIQAYFRSVAGEAHKWVVVFVSGWRATAGNLSVVQSQPSGVVAESQHHMDEADAWLIGLDNRLRNLALGLKLLQAAVY